VNKAIVVAAIILLTVPAQARTEEKRLGVTFDLSYHSTWLSKGAKGYGKQGALFKTIDLDFFGTGFGAKVTHRNATASGYVDSTRFDYRPYYKNQLFKDTSYAMNYNISAGYEHYPGLARQKSNTTWEWIFAFSWPKLLPKGFTPGYIAHYEYAAGSGYRKPSGAAMPSGWVHRFKLDYDVDWPEVAVPLKLSSEVAYTDGLGGAAHDWSYAVFGISSNLKLSDRASFIPGFYQQVSMEDTVNKDDTTYCILSFKYRF